MPKAFTILGLAVAAVTLLVFALDLLLGWPFDTDRPGGTMMDISFIIAALILAYLSWTSYRELA